MCGICGYFNAGNEAALDRMLERMARRGPDDCGKRCEDGVGMGIRRLCIIDPAGGRQPVCNEDRTVWTVFNGEIYNYRALRDDLIKAGHIFRSRCDTEVIVHLYEREGESFVNKLRGMFAICLYDSAAKTLYLARDRMGVKPLYYARTAGGVVFASELPALRQAMPGLSIDPWAISRYLSLGYVPGPGTIFENVNQVAPGEMLIVRNSGVTARRYYSMAREVHPAYPAASEQELIERFQTMLRETVAAHLMSDVPLGLLLSGGIDSGAILAMMRAATNGPVKTFSIGYRHAADAGFNETTSSRFMAVRFGADHTEELLAPDVTGLLDGVIEAMGEPFADSSAIPTFLVSGVARKRVTVALSGIGGDELFGGYPRYLGIRAIEYYRKIPEPLRRLAADYLAPLFPEAGTHRDHAARLKRFLKGGLLPLNRQYLQWITFLPPEWGRNAFSTDFLHYAILPEELTDYIEMFNAWPSDIPADKAMGLDLQTYLSDDLLRMGDRLSMWHSLELRVPFCDHELLSFARSIPASLRLRHWQPKGFMRRALRGIVPDQILKLPKRGFMVPLARWLREDLRELAGDLLSEQAVKKRGYLNPAYVRWLQSRHESGRRNFADQIFSLLVLELWLKKLDARS